MRERRERNYNEHIRRLREIRDLQTDSWERVSDYYYHIEQIGVEINKEIKTTKKLVKETTIIIEDISSFLEFQNSL